MLPIRQRGISQQEMDERKADVFSCFHESWTKECSVSHSHDLSLLLFLSLSSPLSHTQIKKTVRRENRNKPDLRVVDGLGKVVCVCVCIRTLVLSFAPIFHTELKLDKMLISYS